MLSRRSPVDPDRDVDNGAAGAAEIQLAVLRPVAAHTGVAAPKMGGAKGTVQPAGGGHIGFDQGYLSSLCRLMSDWAIPERLLKGLMYHWDTGTIITETGIGVKGFGA